MFMLLTTLHHYIPGAGIFKYISFRAIAALLTSAFMVFIFGNLFIAYLKKWQSYGQPIRDDGPESHFKKVGTPTMGGIIILASVLCSSFLWGNFYIIYFWVSLFVMFSFGAIGLYDDYLKVIKRNSLGFSARLRLLLEFMIAAIAAFIISKYSAPAIEVPFVKNYLLNFGWFFVPLAAFVIVGTGNAVNFTDGLDGLAIVPVIIASCFFAFTAYLCGNAIWANYLQITTISGAGEIAIILMALIGSGLGFLWFNAPPAAMFMGDTGSLALGGLLGCVSIITKQEILLIIVGGIFVLEALSVIIQVASFKIRKKRVFLMAPIHHHFEKNGWSESQIVIRFWIIAIFLALIGLLTLKLR